MKADQPNYVFNLSDVEVETLRRAALERNLSFDANKRTYSAAELSEYGLVREAYNSQELREMGVVNNKVVTSFDFEASSARETLLVDAPFASQIRKWQIPVDICEWRVFIAEFPKGTKVDPHVHAANTPASPGGSMRTVLKGSINYANRQYRPGDWFFIPNGIPYSFTTDHDQETVVMYKYAFFAVAEGNRFSHPIEIERYRVAATDAA
ncbi:cupin domain-containing protein [Bradyrhizobium brasilense]|uniref:cupin domain-containing protein n=1 Tax=Bradyrhizobium brasilense TaxID=1419277 RepID=UPI001E468DF5|nr:hypothetical protein [Bradyrhizobium brasilense]MCC8971585.1 hypothetical protein [Bradyrhizobium brasilense]